jgi:xanthine phosphoribosyltransferase
MPLFIFTEPSIMTDAAYTLWHRSWAEIETDCLDLANRLLVRPYRGIIAIARGGLVPAALLSRVLDIKRIETICISSYEGCLHGELEMVKPPVEDLGDGEGWLLVDDLVDTGATAKVVRAMLPRAHFATLYAKTLGRPWVDTCVGEVEQTVWIVFPWETGPWKGPDAHEPG